MIYIEYQKVPNIFIIFKLKTLYWLKIIKKTKKFEIIN